jgi:hypothetical protein
METKQIVLATTVTATTAVEPYKLCGFAGTYPDAGTAALGIFAEDGEAGDSVAVDEIGNGLLITGGAVDAGAEIEAGADGVGVAKTTGVAVARAITAAAAPGEIIRVKLV